MRLYLLSFGTYEPSGAPFPGYLIQADDGTNVLVDTGLARSRIGVEREPGSSGARMGEEDYVVNRLAALGLAPRDVGYVVCTHFDWDHAGGHDAFPDAEFVVQRAQYEVAQRHQRFHDGGKHWNHPALRYRLVDGDIELLPGVELIETSGHVPGHQSVLVRLPHTGPVILAIDAIPGASFLDPDRRPIMPYDMDGPSTRASTRKLVDLAESVGAAMIIRGHDAAQWKRLKKAPEYYD